MLNHHLFFWVVALMVAGTSWAGNAPELLDQLNDDPSLLLDPKLAIEEAPAPAPTPAPAEREPSSTPAAEPAIEPAPTPAPASTSAPNPAPTGLSLLPSEAAPEQTASSKGVPSFLKSKKLSEVVKEPTPAPAPASTSAPNPAPTGLSLLPSEAAPEETASSKGKQVAEPLTGHGPVPQTPELVALPGVVDFSVILSGSQFYPARIRMKSGPKARIIFTTTGRKPAALVFEKLQINRWIAGEGEKPVNTSAGSSPVQEYRELSTSRVTEINFDATPGKYEFYDALSGAAGEIIVD